MVKQIELKIATFNICHCQDYSVSINDDGPVDIEKFSAYIKESGMDIVALNEVYISSPQEQFNNQTEKISKMSNYPYFVQAVGKELPWTTIGNAILSQYPIESVTTVPIPAPTENEKRLDENEWYEDRVIVSALLNINGKKVNVISTHFGLNGLEKERMVNSLCNLIDNSNHPIILLGDFNDKPHSEILMPIYERLNSCADLMNNNDFTFASFNPYMTIDYIFISKDISPVKFEVKKDILSDHRMILAHLNI